MAPDLPSVRPVHLRSRPDGSAAARRVAALMPRGWVPPEEDEPGPAEPGLAEQEQEQPPVVADAAAHPSEQSWGARRPGAHLVAGPRWDPGRRGAVALVVVAALAALVATGVVLRGRPQEVAVPVLEDPGVPLPGAAAPSAPAGEVVVAVGGKVRRPGLVRLPAGSRVDDAVRAAGGALSDADTGLLNLARRLVDGEQVLVGVDPPAGAAGPAAPAVAGGGLLDLNTASASDLDALPGIGPVLAQRIVDWRTRHGRFASVDQLREVTGIGEAKYEDLREKVTV